jgi:hypothetical protein
MHVRQNAAKGVRIARMRGKKTQKMCARGKGHAAAQKSGATGKKCRKKRSEYKVYNDAFEQSSSAVRGCARANPTWW